MLSLPEFFLKDEPRMTGNCCVFTEICENTVVFFSDVVWKENI